jgi:hypothetical protein
VPLGARSSTRCRQNRSGWLLARLGSHIRAAGRKISGLTGIPRRDWLT